MKSGSDIRLNRRTLISSYRQLKPGTVGTMPAVRSPVFYASAKLLCIHGSAVLLCDPVPVKYPGINDRKTDAANNNTNAHKHTGVSELQQ